MTLDGRLLSVGIGRGEVWERDKGLIRTRSTSRRKSTDNFFFGSCPTLTVHQSLSSYDKLSDFQNGR